MWIGNMSKSKTKRELEQEKRNTQPYAIDKFATIKPIWKILFLRFWVAGVSYFLAFQTIELVREDNLDQYVALFILLLLLTEFVTNKLILFMHREDQPTVQYLPFGVINRKSAWSLFSTALYVGVLFTVIIFVHIGIVELFTALGIPTLTFLLTGEQKGLDAISYGLYFLAFEFIWFGIKQLILHYINKKKGASA
jgi:hypothetical protein